MPSGGKRDNAGRKPLLTSIQKYNTWQIHQHHCQTVVDEINLQRIKDAYSKHEIEPALQRFLALDPENAVKAYRVMKYGEEVTCPRCGAGKCHCEQINEIGSEMAYRSTTLDRVGRFWPGKPVRGYKPKAVLLTLAWVKNEYGVEIKPSYLKDFITKHVRDFREVEARILEVEESLNSQF